jgi:hypothetical protein
MLRASSGGFGVVVLLIVPACATFAPDEPPHAEAISDSPTAPTIASARADRFVIRAPFAELAMSSPSQLTDPGCLIPLYENGGYSTVTTPTQSGKS